MLILPPTIKAVTAVAVVLHAVVVAKTLLESPPLAVSFVITTTVHHLKPQRHHLYRPDTANPRKHRFYSSPIPTPVDVRVAAASESFVSSAAALSDTYSHSTNCNSTSCCVIHSLEFPFVALEVSERLSLPLITPTAVSTDLVTDEGDAQQQQQMLLLKYQHAIVIEPYTYEYKIHNYSIGIVSLNDSSNIRNSQKNRKSGKLRMPKMNPFLIDFMPPINSLLGRRTYGDSGQPDLLLKAVRLPPSYCNRNNENRFTQNTDDQPDDTDRLKPPPEQQPIMIYDVTAGFGQDSLLIAHNMIKNRNKSTSSTNTGNMGRVHMIERNPIIAALLQDALRRLRLIATSAVSDDHSKNIAQQLSQCLSMEWDDGHNALMSIHHNKNGTVIPDIVYFDPMFPTRKKSASVKKNMQILHSLLQEEHTTDDDCSDDNSAYPQPNNMTRKDAEESILLQLAYHVARYRVVVKRPIHAPPIAGSLVPPFDSNTTATTTSMNIGTNVMKPSYQIIGSINRWDVYNKD